MYITLYYCYYLLASSLIILYSKYCVINYLCKIVVVWQNGGCVRFPVQHYMLQGSHVGYDGTHNGIAGAAGAHVIPTALAQYVGRHYAAQLPTHGYSIPASTWLPQYVMQPAPPHHLTQLEVCYYSILQV